MSHDVNPFPRSDADRHAIWDMLVAKDIDGFVACDWSLFAGSFRTGGFLGLDANRSLDPVDWRPRFPSVPSYRDAWLAGARRAAGTRYAEPLRNALFRATNMLDIRVAGDVATARKIFDDAIALADGGLERLNWQSTFFCARDSGAEWKITGFVGYMPLASSDPA